MQTASIRSCFISVYNSAAEVLPEDFSQEALGITTRVKDADDTDIVKEISLFTSSDMETAQALVQKHGAEALPRRWIGQSHVTALFWFYISICHDYGVEAASMRQFLREWHGNKWSKVLRFRTTSSHSQCTLCWDLRREITSKGTPAQDRLEAAKELGCHLEDQYTDRVFYWCGKASSRAHGDTCVLIADSMDKSILESFT